MYQSKPVCISARFYLKDPKNSNQRPLCGAEAICRQQTLAPVVCRKQANPQWQNFLLGPNVGILPSWVLPFGTRLPTGAKFGSPAEFAASSLAQWSVVDPLQSCKTALSASLASAPAKQQRTRSACRGTLYGISLGLIVTFKGLSTKGLHRPARGCLRTAERVNSGSPFLQ